MRVDPDTDDDGAADDVPQGLHLGVAQELRRHVIEAEQEVDRHNEARHRRLTRFRVAGRPADEQFAVLDEINELRHRLDDRNPVRQIGPGGQPQD